MMKDYLKRFQFNGVLMVWKMTISNIIKLGFMKFCQAKKILKKVSIKMRFLTMQFIENIQL